jgi:hypothetical protein
MITTGPVRQNGPGGLLTAGKSPPEITVAVPDAVQPLLRSFATRVYAPPTEATYELLLERLLCGGGPLHRKPMTGWDVGKADPGGMPVVLMCVSIMVGEAQVIVELTGVIFAIGL